MLRKVRPPKPGKGNDRLVGTATAMGLPNGFNIQPPDMQGGLAPRFIPEKAKFDKTIAIIEFPEVRYLDPPQPPF